MGEQRNQGRIGNSAVGKKGFFLTTEILRRMVGMTGCGSFGFPSNTSAGGKPEARPGELSVHSVEILDISRRH